MRWAHYKSLTDEAKAALDKGDGKHGRYAVNDNHIALLDASGRAGEWVKVIKSNNPIIEEFKA